MSDACTPRIPVAMSSPSLNRGVGFTHEQRRALGLIGRLPSAVLTLEQQADRVWHQLQSMATDLGRNLLLEQLHYRHELLYYKVLADHLPELMPVVYTPTVGEGVQRFCYRHGIDYLRTTSTVPADALVLRYLRQGGLVR